MEVHRWQFLSRNLCNDRSLRASSLAWRKAGMAAPAWAAELCEAPPVGGLCRGSNDSFGVALLPLPALSPGRGWRLEDWGLPGWGRCRDAGQGISKGLGFFCLSYMPDVRKGYRWPITSLAVGLRAGIAKGWQEGVDANRTSAFRVDPTKPGLEEEELLAQFPSNPGGREGKHSDSEEENILASLKAQQFSDRETDPRVARGKKGKLDEDCYKVLDIKK